tara:strand:+ start:524 stop:898 length:375 start_codon:yes stop_codon:yes gene_type:complete
MINNTKKGSTKKEVKQHLQNSGERNLVGSSGGLGFIGGANIVSAGRQILKSGLGRGAINYVKNIFSKKTPVGSGPSRGGNFNEIANQKLREGLNKTKVPKSKPVEFMGPNPANKIGAGKNSYPR